MLRKFWGRGVTRVTRARQRYPSSEMCHRRTFRYHGGLAVWSKESAILRGIMIGAQGDVEGCFGIAATEPDSCTSILSGIRQPRLWWFMARKAMRAS